MSRTQGCRAGNAVDANKRHKKDKDVVCVKSSNEE